MTRPPTSKTSRPRTAARRLRARVIRRDQVDLDRLKTAFLALATARAEKEAEDFHAASDTQDGKEGTRNERSA